MSTAQRAGLIGLLLLFTAVWFSNLEYRKLVRPDEGRYAEIAREMAQSGDWVTPRLNGLKYFEKPPLQYWATAAAFRVFGDSQWGARWWPATTTFASILLMFWAGRRLFNTAVGISAAATMAGCSGVLIIAHLNTLDAGLSAFLTISLLSFLLAQHAGATVREHRGWMRTMWMGLALAVLSKGLIGVVLPGAVLAIYIFVERDWRLLTRLRMLEGVGIFLLITAPWFIAVSLANDEFARFFFIREHFDRFLTTVHHREGSGWYFIPILLYGMMPWTPMIAVRLRNGWQRTADVSTPRPLQPLRLLLIWSGFVFIFFSASHSKLPSYILPMFPALSLFAAVEMQRMSSKTLSCFAWGLAALGGVLFFVVFLGGEWIASLFVREDLPLTVVIHLLPWALASIAAFTAGASTAAGLLRCYPPVISIIALAFGSMSASVLLMNGHNTLSTLSSSAEIIAEVETQHGPFDRSAPFYSIQMYDQTVPFYLKRTVTLVESVGEFAMGLAAEPEKGIAHVADWKQRWMIDRTAYAIMKPDTYQRLYTEGVPMQVLARDPRRVIVRRP